MDNQQCFFLIRKTPNTAGKGAASNFMRQGKECYRELSSEERCQLVRESEEGADRYKKLTPGAVMKTVSGITKKMKHLVCM